MLKYKIPLIYAFFYGLLVAMLSGLFFFLPWSMSLEYQLYDSIQQKTVIDSKSDWQYSHYAPWLEQVSLINLDSSFFNKETDRIKTDKLAKLIEKIDTQLLGSKVLFLDYQYNSNIDKDTVLFKALSKIQRRLILPLGIEINKKIAIRGKASQLKGVDVELKKQSQAPALAYGYTSPFKDPYSFSNRYYKYRTDDSSYYSVPYLIQKQISSQPEKNLYEKGLTELKFILRNEDVLNKERAILVYDAKYMLDGRMTKENVKSVIEDKIVFIGLFDNNYKTKHGLTIDKFLTPVQPDMSGSMLLVNAWLNLAAGGLVRVSPVLLIFLFNFIVALIMSIWYQSVRGKQWSAMITLFINLGISLILFPVVGLLLFFFLEVKLALGISLLLFQYHYQIFVYIKEKNISDAKNN